MCIYDMYMYVIYILCVYTINMIVLTCFLYISDIVIRVLLEDRVVELLFQVHSNALREY